MVLLLTLSMKQASTTMRSLVVHSSGSLIYEHRMNERKKGRNRQTNKQKVVRGLVYI